MKKRCLIYSNCQGEISVKKLLEYHPEFSSQYNIDFLHNYNNEKIYKKPDNVDLIIYQPVKWFEKPSCNYCAFPYIYDDGTFNVHHGTGGFKIIDDLISEGKDVLDMYDKGIIDFKLDERKQKSLEILKNKETECNIKISDFLEHNSHLPLFFTHNHPTMHVMVEVTNRILTHLKMERLYDGSKIGWGGNYHIDLTGMCHFPGDKEKSTLQKSILPLDKYSSKNQKKIFNYYTNEYEDFYIKNDLIVRGKILEHIHYHVN